MTVEFRVKDAFVGDRSEAAIKIETVLGAKYLALVPRGAGGAGPRRAASRWSARRRPTTSSRPSPTCPRRSRRSTPPSWPARFEVLAETFADTPDEVRTSLEGLARLSDTIASRDDAAAAAAVGHPRGHPGARRPQRRVHPADPRLQRPAHRGAGTAGADRLDPRPAPRSCARQLSGLVADNREALTPALQQLSTVTDILSRNRAALAQTVNNLAPFVRVFTNTLGNGRWFDSFVNDLLPTVVGSVALHRRRATPVTGCSPTEGGTDERHPAARRRARRRPRAPRRAGLDGPPAGRPVPGHRLLHRDRRPLLRAPTSASSASPVGDDHRRHRRWATGCGCEMLIDDDYDIPADADADRPGAVAGLRPLRAVLPGLRRRPDHGGRRRGARWTARPPRSSSTRSTARSTSCRPPSAPPAPTRTAPCPTSSTSARPTSTATVRR